MISLAKLAKRDKWICHICTRRVERLSDASRDHVRPKFYGGHSLDSNIFLAHKWCNESKGNKFFKVEQDRTGWVIVDPNGMKSDMLYSSYIEALIVASRLNEDKLYLEDRYK